MATQGFAWTGLGFLAARRPPGASLGIRKGRTEPRPPCLPCVHHCCAYVGDRLGGRGKVDAACDARTLGALLRASCRTGICEIFPVLPEARATARRCRLGPVRQEERDGCGRAWEGLVPAISRSRWKVRLSPALFPVPPCVGVIGDRRVGGTTKLDSRRTWQRIVL